MFGSRYYFSISIHSKIGFRTVFGCISTYWCNVWNSLLYFNSLPSKFVFSTIFGGISTYWWIVREYKIGFRSIIGDISTYWCNVWLSLLLFNSIPSMIGLRTIFGGIGTYCCNVLMSLLHFDSIPSQIGFRPIFGVYKYFLVYCLCVVVTFWLIKVGFFW